MNRSLIAALVVAGAALAVSGCGNKEFQYDTNLITNGSFEDVGKDGIPSGWKLLPFRGKETDNEVMYKIDEGVAQDGNRSWSFVADPGTQRFHMLAQEVAVPEDATHVKLTGWMQLEDVGYEKDQYQMCNFLLTFFDENHVRFQELRDADKATRLRVGSQLWSQEDQTFRLPVGTRYVQVSCALGMNGRVWFDNITLSVPRPLPWEEATTKNYVFHWLPGHPMPEGSMQSQQSIFDGVAARLGVTSDVVIQYYFYPDTTTIRDLLSLRGYQYASWDDYEFHSINPNDDHEVVHFITDPLGRPPRAIAEGTVFWLQNQWGEYPLNDVVAQIARAGKLPDLRHLIDYNLMAMGDPDIYIPSAASFVEFIVDRFGTPKLLELYTASHGINSYRLFAVAFEQVYGVPAAEAENAWHEWLKGQFAKK
jgi:hypothetical protein